MIRISQYMTPGVHTIGLEQTVEQARELLRVHGIRHLPVLQGGRLVGVVTQRDINLILGPKGVDPDEATVEEAMSQDVFAVEPTASLAEVCTIMARRKLGAAIVAKGGHVEGIFTTVDACRALAEVLRGGAPKAAEPAAKPKQAAASKPAAKLPATGAKRASAKKTPAKLPTTGAKRPAAKSKKPAAK